MKTFLISLGVICTIFLGCHTENEPETAYQPHVKADNPVEAGRYLVTVGMCNDCHTEGYMAVEGNIPEDDWLTGSKIGWRGPWGTTYPVNLRLRAQELTEEQWVEQLRTRKVNPPMPWMNVNKMNEQDARAIYAYLRAMGPKGERMPIALAPNQEPTTPYLNMVPLNLPPMAGGGASN
jgi:mono/diheme cytochrome c family protein